MTDLLLPHLTDKRHFTSAPMRIGKTDWRISVVDSYTYGRVTLYEWFDEWRWRADTNHPRFDSNDTYNGLPKGLRRLFNANLDALEQHGVEGLKQS